MLAWVPAKCDELPLTGQGLFRVVQTRANRQPALAVYRLDPRDSVYRAWGIWVLAIDGDAIAEITAFVDPTLVPRFGLPSELDGN